MKIVFHNGASIELDPDNTTELQYIKNTLDMFLKMQGELVGSDVKKIDERANLITAIKEILANLDLSGLVKSFDSRIKG